MNSTPSSGDIFQSPAWFELLLKCGFERKPYWVGNLPIPPIGGGTAGYMPLMRMTPTSAIRGISNYYTPLFGPVWSGHGAIEDSALRAFAKAFLELPGSDVLMLQPLAADAPFVRALERGLIAHGYRLDRYFCFGNWYESIGHRSFVDYWMQRPSRLRHTVERARRRLDQSHTWRTEVVESHGDSLEQAVDAFCAVYSRSWKAPEPCPEFMPGLIRMAAGIGALRLGQLWLDGEVVASQVWLVRDGKASIYKLAYVPGYEKLSLGSVLTAALMHHVIDRDKVAEVDYLMGDDAYKQDWMTSRRERVGLVAFHPTRIRGLCAWVQHHARRFFRRHVLR